MMKYVRIICVALVMFIAFGNPLYLQNAYGANQVTLQGTKVTAKPGEEVEIKINISADSQLASGGIDIYYDTNLMSVVSAEKGSIFSSTGTDDTNMITVINDQLPSYIRFACAGAEKLVKGGDLIVIKFKINSDIAQDKTIPIEIKVDELSTYDASFKTQKLSYKTENGEIKVSAKEEPSDGGGTSSGGTSSGGNVIQPPYTLTKKDLANLDVISAVEFKMAEGTKVDEKGVMLCLKLDDISKYDKNALAVVFIDAQNNKHIIPMSTYNSEDKSMHVLIYKEGTYGVIYNYKTYNDTKEHWAKDYITYLSAHNIVNGKEENIFEPNSSVTRAEFVKMLACMADIDVSQYKESKFSDVSENQWYAPYIQWAAENKIVNGITEKEFKPNDTISREQMAAMLYRYAEYIDYKFASGDSDAKFADDTKISEWANTYVYAMQKAGLISGKDGNIFDPSNNATRGESAKVIALFIEKMVSENNSTQIK